MMDEPLDIDVDRAYARLEQISRRAEDLPAEAREIVDEILEAFAVSIEELQVAAGELNQQNQELLAAQEEIEAQRRRYQDLFEFAPDGYLVTDPAGIIRETNQAAVNLLGVPKLELAKKPLVLYVAHGEQDRFHMYLDRLAKGRGSGADEVEWEMRIQPRQGQAFPAALTVAPILNFHGELTGLRWLLRDITASERAEERERLQQELQRHAERLKVMVAERTAALRAREAQLRTIFEDSFLGIALLDTEGKIITSNPALQNMLGYSEEQLFGSRFEDYYHPDDPEESQALYQSLVSGDQGHYQVERRYLRKDGQVRWSFLTVSSVKETERGNSRLAIVMMEDITERKMDREALFRAEKLALAGRLSASLTHEINNPLQAVIGCLGLAEEILEDGADARQYLNIAMDELERAASILARLRDLSRETEVKEKEPADLNALVDKTLLLTRKKCQNRGVEVEWSPVVDLPLVPLVPDRMQQVFLNLVLNAVEAMTRGGRLCVNVTLTSDPEGVNIQFADTGVGIESGRLGHIFEPFHSHRHEGLGLGLYISRTIVEEQGGYIEVGSQVGEGSTFTVWLPM
jgi:PAS domain S-box-containing protein